MTKMYPTKNALAEDTREALVALLNETLASSVHLQLQAKQAHWNVKGPSFFQLHELFDQVYTEATEWSDSLAERAVQLGGLADSTLETVIRRTKLAAYPLELPGGRDHADALSNGLAVFAKSVHVGIGKADALGDPATADLYTEIARDVDKILWMIEAHLQADR